MCARWLFLRFLTGAAIFCCAYLFGQSSSNQSSSQSSNQSRPPVSSGPVVQEFPVNMRQNVVAGKTRVGTKVEASLSIATLVKGKVIPADAIFSGEVVESAAKTATESSRLAIRMDSVRWKNEAMPITLYLTAWYYPMRMETDEEQSNNSLARLGRRGGSASSSTGASFPGRPPGADFPPPLAGVSENREVMKDVESARESDGTLVISSSHLNLKLDRATTYVLAPGPLTPGK